MKARFAPRMKYTLRVYKKSPALLGAGAFF